MESNLALSDKFNTIALQLNESVANVLSNPEIQGFQRAYLVADAVGKLKEVLTKEYMKPIMNLQNNRLGFKTDKKDGYPEPVVQNCLIEAVLMGVQPVGNHFNIISESSYITKEGFGYLLKKIVGLVYEIIPGIPKIDSGKGSAEVLMTIKWQMNGGAAQVREINFVIKVNSYMGADAVIGKATRKARAWLYNTLNDNGVEIPEGDVTDMAQSEREIKKIEQREKIENLTKEEPKQETTDEPTITLDELRDLLDLKSEALSVAELKKAKAIVNDKVEEKYADLHKFLKTK